MVVTQDQGGRPPAAGRRSVSPARVTGGIAVMCLGVALMSYGAHFLAKTGTCSGTGYVSYGPVPKCGGNEALYIMSAFFVGPMAAVAGWLVARAWGWLWPTFCIGVGAGLITIRNETTAAPGAKMFGLVGGICLFALAGLSVIVSLRKRRRRRGLREAAGPGLAAGPEPAVLASMPASAPIAAARVRAATGDRQDPLDTIAKLAHLRDTGALTEDEFEIQKAKLLAEI